MQAILSKVKSILRYHKKVRIDNVVFNLHKITAGVLFVMSLVVSSALYISKSAMTCINDKTVDRVIDAYCWIHATYTLPEKLPNNQSIVAHPGVAPHNPTDETRIHKYYQWVCFVLFFQAIAFYAPRWLWKNLEGNRIKALSENLDDLTKDEGVKNKRKQQCLEYFHKSLGSNDGWSMSFAFCEVLNFINVVIQIDLTDRFVGRALSKYGFSLITGQLSRINPMYRKDELSIAFPTIAKCTFHAYGPSGNIINYDALCVLPFNIYNEKFYPLLWMWFIILAVLSGLALVYRFATYLSPEFRYQLLRRKFHIEDEELDNVWQMNRYLDYGDWYLLYQVGKNMGVSTFLEFLNDLSQMTVTVGSELPFGEKPKHKKYL